MKKVLVAGSTGYLGQYLLKELKKQGYYTIALARNPSKLNKQDCDVIVRAEVTEAESLNGICANVDVVISTVGITWQKDGLTYMDVDYGANSNLLKEAMKSNVGKFIYVSVLNGENLKELKMVAAKERFVDELKYCGLEYCVIRPNGFFSDMREVLDMANKGMVYLFGNGDYKGNPIHGADLAAFIVSNIDSREKELDVGGPDLLTQNQIAEAAFNAVAIKPKIVHIPVWIRNITLGFIRFFTNQKSYGPLEFFMTVMTRDMIAPRFGLYHLSDYYHKTINQHGDGT